MSLAKRLREGESDINDPQFKADMLRQADEIIALLLEYGATEDNK